MGREGGTSVREHEEFNDGTDGQGVSGNLWQGFIWPFQFLGEGRGSLGKISAQLYIFIIHMLIGILNIIASPSNFPWPFAFFSPPHRTGNGIYLTWMLKSV